MTRTIILTAAVVLTLVFYAWQDSVADRCTGEVVLGFFPPTARCVAPAP